MSLIATLVMGLGMVLALFWSLMMSVWGLLGMVVAVAVLVGTLGEDAPAGWRGAATVVRRVLLVIAVGVLGPVIGILLAEALMSLLR